MRSRLLQLAKGNVDYKAPEIELETEKLTGTLCAGKRHQIDVNIVSKNGVPMRLFFYSDDSRVGVSQPLSVGRFGKMSVTVNTCGAQLYERVTGRIRMLYNGGECALPYDFTVGFEEKSLQDREIRTADDFADFADENPLDAASLFAKENFLLLPFMKDIRYYGLYRAFLSNDSEDYGLNEFLCAAGLRKKETEEDASDANNASAAPLSVSEQLRRLPKTAFSEAGKLKKIEYRTYVLYLHYSKLLADGDPENPGFFKDMALLLQDAPEEPLPTLLAAYAYFKAGNRGKASEILYSVSDRVQRDKLAKKDEYSVYLYLSALISNDNERLDGARRLIHRYYLEGTFTNLSVLAEFLSNPDYRNHRKAIDYMRLNYLKGFKSSLCLQKTAYLWAQETPDITLLTEYELMVLIYGMRHGILTEQCVFEVLSHELKDSRFKALYLQVLKTGWRVFASDPFLQSLINVYIGQGLIGPDYFKWYRAAVERNLSIPGICDYYMQSLPADFSGPLPETLVRYFGFNGGIPDDKKVFLFTNVLAFYQDEPGIFELYQDKIRAFAFDRLREQDYDISYFPIFESLLESISGQKENIGLTLKLFNLYLIQTKEKAARLAVIYPELNRVEVFPVRGEETLIPVETEHAVVVCEEENGRRFFDPGLKRMRAFLNPELEEKIRKAPVGSLAARVGLAEEKILLGEPDNRFFFELTDLLAEKSLTPFVRARFYEALISLTDRPSMEHADWGEVLSGVDVGLLSKETRKKLCHVLIGCGRYAETMKIIREYGDPGISRVRLEALLTHCEKATQEEILLLSGICYGYYLSDNASDEILSFLGCSFVGLSSEMMGLCNTIHRSNLPDGGLYARTLKVCLYVDNDTDTDRLFGWYSTVPTENQDTEVNRAYVVFRSYRYFRYGKKMPEAVSELLKKEASKLPDICMFACLAELASWAGSLSDQDKRVSEELLNTLAERNIVLGCMTELSGMVRFPAELEGCVFVEFRDEKAERAMLDVRLMPDGKTFRKEMQMPAPGVFTKALVLFKDEGAEVTATFYDPDGSERKGKTLTLTAQSATERRGSQYDHLNRLSQKCRDYDFRETAEETRSYLKKRELIELIFGGKWKN